MFMAIAFGIISMTYYEDGKISKKFEMILRLLIGDRDE